MKANFLRLLKDLDAEELREELTALYGRFPAVREYYRMELAESTKTVVDKYKREMHKAFFPSRGRGKRGRSVSRRVIRDFKEVAIHQRDLIELYFYRAELMTDYLKARRVDSDAFHESTVKSFREACTLAEREVMLAHFGPGARALTELFEANRRNRHFSLWPVYREFWPE